MEVAPKEYFPNFWVLGTYPPELAAAELVASGVIHGPVIDLGVVLGVEHVEPGIVDPLLDLPRCPEGESADEVVGLFKEDLSSGDADAFDRGVEEDLSSQCV